MSIEAQRGSGGVAPVHSNLGDRSGEVIRTKPGLLHPKKHTIPILQKRAWVSGAVWTALKILTPPGIDCRTVQPVANRIYFSMSCID